MAQTMPTIPASGRIRRLLRRPAVLLLLALLTVAAVVSLLGRLAGGGETNLKKTQLSDEAGGESYPSFSPDGAAIAYSGRAPGKGDTYHIFVRPAGGGAARQLTSGEGSDIGPAWSPDGGRIALARSAGGSTEYLAVPAGGGDAAAIARTGAAEEINQWPSLAWMRDGASLVVVMRAPKQPTWLALAPAAGGGPKRLTTPPEGSEGDVMPAASPDRLWIAFVRRTGPEGGDVWVCDASGGGVRRITFDDQPVRGIAWSADSREVVYSANRIQGWGLWRVPAAGGSPRRILDAGRHAQYPAIAAKGRKLVYAESPSAAALWRAEIADPSRERPIVRSQGRESAPSFSADGQRIAFRSDRTGHDEIWTADADGGHPAQVTQMKGAHLGRPRWSPDGKTIVFDARTNADPDLYTVPANGGKATRITASGSSSPVFSPDGKWIYHGVRQIWRIAPDGGTPSQMTRLGGSGAAPSPDGKWIYYRRGRDIRRIAATGGSEEDVYTLADRFVWGSASASNQGVYFLEWPHGERKLQLTFFDVREKRARAVMQVERADMDRGVSFDISPDGKWIVYTKLNQAETNLVVLDGFR
jgi:Tol biopolymer transport system component